MSQGYMESKAAFQVKIVDLPGALHLSDSLLLFWDSLKADGLMSSVSN